MDFLWRAWSEEFAWKVSLHSVKTDIPTIEMGEMYTPHPNKMSEATEIP